MTHEDDRAKLAWILLDAGSANERKTGIQALTSLFTRNLSRPSRIALAGHGEQARMTGAITAGTRTQIKLMQIIIAPGNLRDNRSQTPVVGSLDVGGLTLTQRALRSAALAGATHATILLPAQHELSIQLAKDSVLEAMQLSFVGEAPVTLDGLSATRLLELPGLQEEFLVLPGDRVLTPAILKQLIQNPGALALLDEADEVIAARLTPGHLEATACDAPGDVTSLIDALHITRRTISDKPELMQVRDEQDAKVAREALFKTLRKPLTRNGDGLTAYLINRPISLTLSRQLVKLPVTPNHVTFFNLLLGLYAGYMLASGDFMGIAIGAFLMQLVSIFDGIDGELARMKLLQSPLGAWFDVVSDDVARVATITGLGISCYKLNPDPAYVWAVVGGTIAILSTVFTLYRDLRQESNASLNSVKWFFEEEGRKPGPWQTFLVILSFILKRDTYTFILMAIAAVGFPQLALFVMVFGIAIITSTHFIQKLVRVLKGQEAPQGNAVAINGESSKEMSRA